MNQTFFVLAAFAYCLGSISSAVFICKLCQKPDPRTEGSGNPGATNVLRVAGKPYAAMVLFFDVLKGALPVMMAKTLGLALPLQTWIGVLAVLGHMFPIFMRFKGGKGVATALGFIAIFSYQLTGWLLIVFALIVSLSRMVSLGSVITALAAPVLYYAVCAGGINSGLVLLALLITFKHRSNLHRIVKGTENRV